MLNPEPLTIVAVFHLAGLSRLGFQMKQYRKCFTLNIKVSEVFAEKFSSVATRIEYFSYQGNSKICP